MNIKCYFCGNVTKMLHPTLYMCTECLHDLHYNVYTNGKLCKATIRVVVNNKKYAAVWFFDVKDDVPSFYLLEDMNRYHIIFQSKEMEKFTPTNIVSKIPLLKTFI